MICEAEEDVRVVEEALAELKEMDLLPIKPTGWRFLQHPTPQTDGKYDVIPYSNKINYALDRIQTDAVVYLDNGSMPTPEKYEIMMQGIEAGHDAVYCAQQHTGFDTGLRGAHNVVTDPYCRLNFTQVMHTVGPERWTLDMRYANPDLADAMFFRDLVPRVHAFFPVGPADKPLDFHHIPSPAASNLTPQ